MLETSDSRESQEDGNPASDLKTDVIKDIERDDTITSDVVGPRGDEVPDDSADADGD